MKWQLMKTKAAKEAIEGMNRLPISCERYSYFGTKAHPVIKFDSRKGIFYYNEYYTELIS